MTALLGVDLGERRIGVALADGPDVGARPLVTLPAAVRSRPTPRRCCC